MNVESLPSRRYILEFLGLRASDPPTTAEIIHHVVQRDATCKDKVPMVLRKLEAEGLITKVVSPAKRGLVWTLTETQAEKAIQT